MYKSYRYMHLTDNIFVPLLQQNNSTVFSCSRIELFMLTDQFEASLIILKRRFCWDYLDIAYIKQVVFNSAKKQKLSDKAVTKLLSVERNLGDLILYEAANATWWSQPELKEPDFWPEVDTTLLLYSIHCIFVYYCNTCRNLLVSDQFN
jgi:hypothetical protein